MRTQATRVRFSSIWLSGEKFMSGRAAIQKSTGKFIEFQSGKGTIGGPLMDNAISTGIPKDEYRRKVHQYTSATTDRNKIDVIARILKLE